MRRPALALLLGCLLLVAGASALDGYDYYQTIEYAGCDQDIYQQDIVIHRSTGTAYNETAGGLETWHIFIGEHCREDYGDVRFTNSTGELAYYLWPDYTSSSARFAVRLEGADAAGALTVWYGSAAATTTSDGAATYILHDHFDGAAGAAPDSDLWEVVKKGSTSATVKLDGNGNLLLAGAPGVISSGNAWGKPMFARGVMIEYRDKIDNAYYPDVSIGSGDLQGYDGDAWWWHTRLASGYYVMTQIGHVADECFLSRTPAAGPPVTLATASSSSPAYPALDTYYTHRFVWSSANDLIWIRDSATVATANDPTYQDSEFRLALSQGEYSNGCGGTRTIDYVLIRAYSATPPAATTFSGEQETTAPPVTAFTATPTGGTAPLTVQFTDRSTGGPTSWLWTFGDGNTSSTDQNPTHTYTTAGAHTVTLTATNEYGSDYELKTDYITVYGPVTAKFSASPTGGTAPLTVTFTDTSTGGPTSWSWTFGDGNTSTDQNPAHTYTTAGAHTVNLTASHPYDSDTETKTSYITVAVLQPFPGLALIPRDLAGNGLYTDINGNNRLDYNDLTVFFQNLAWAKTAQPIACFDFNGNGWLDYNDVITLFSTILEEHT